MREALITGATGNIGHAVCTALGNAAWRVVGLSKSGQQYTIACDLTRWQAVNYTAERYLIGPYDLVVFAHGTTVLKPTQDYTEADYRKVLDTNLMGSIALTHSLLQRKLLAHDALLVYISSIHAAAPREWRGLYAASKAGLEAFALTVAQEHSFQQRALALRLGQCNTLMQCLTTDDRQYMGSRLLSELLDVNAVAKFIVNLYDQPCLTGCVLTYDGGQGANIW